MKVNVTFEEDLHADMNVSGDEGMAADMGDVIQLAKKLSEFGISVKDGKIQQTIKKGTKK